MINKLGKEKIRICNICGRAYEYALSVHIKADGTRICRHDSEVKGKCFKPQLLINPRFQKVFRGSNIKK